jgi:hypothetical protein
MSATVRVCGTKTSHVGYRGQTPRGEMTSREPVYATSALFEAGERPELTVSDPSPKAAKLAAVEVADPFDEPDENAAVRYSRLYGLSARPYKPRCIPEAIIGGVLVLPMHTAPALRSCSATKESSLATRFANAGDPEEQVMPLYFMLFLRVYGTPSKGPLVLPWVRLSSEASASLKTSGFSLTIELRHGPWKSYVWMRRRYLATRSTLVMVPEVRASCRSVMDASTMFWSL